MVLALLVVCGVAWGLTPDAGGGVPLATVSVRPHDGAGKEMMVHVTGAVTHPGVVSLDGGARVADAIDAVGGLAPDADESAVNLARIVGDGEQIFVPRLGEVEDSRVNINRADAEALEDLPGIGPVLAARIVSDRADNGPYSSVADLSRVPGIGEAVLDEIAALATV
jgi:competence protein ComEA